MTAAQQRVWHGYQRARRRLGRKPRLEEVAASAGLSSSSGVHRHLRTLARRGELVVREDGTYEAVTTVDVVAEVRAVADSLVPYPVFDAQRERLNRVVATLEGRA